MNSPPAITMVRRCGLAGLSGRACVVRMLGYGGRVTTLVARTCCVEGMNMTDRELQEHVQKALDWEPSIDAADIGVSVGNGVVTLRGDVSSYAEKSAAERAT
jgi:hypothetical protein